MITFKQFLTEKKMSSSVYAQTFKRLEDDAKIGFEIEVFIPEGTFFHADQDLIPSKTIKPGAIDSWSEIRTYYAIDKDLEGTIMNDFNKWKTEKEDDFIDENWRDFADEESKTFERDGRKTALRYAENKFTFSAWLKTIGGIHDLVGTYKLKPKHGATEAGDIHTGAPAKAGYTSGWKNTGTVFAEHLSKVLKQKVTVDAQGKAYTDWNLVHDSSIKNAEGEDYEASSHGGYGIEIVSPPLAPSKAMADLEKVFKVLQKYEIQTNESTAIHVNISLPELSHFDPLKCVLFMGDKHVLEKFNRAENVFTMSQLQRVIDSISANGTIPTSVPELIALGTEGLKETSKYYSVNLQHLPKYLEFRAAGGENYHERLTEIQEVVGRWLTAVEIAADPMLYRRDYLKKVMQLIDKTPSSQEAKEQQNLSFEQLVKKNNGLMAWNVIQDSLAGNDQAYRVKALYALLITLHKHLHKIQPTLKNYGEVRALLRRTGVTVQDLQKHATSTGQSENVNRLNTVLERFKLV